MPKPKPFGKPILKRRRLPWRAKAALALALSAPLAFLLFALPARAFPTLASFPLFAPSAVTLFLFFGSGAAAWLRRRPVPRGPWESPGFFSRLFLRFKAALLALPTALLAAFCFAPALGTVNGLLSGPSSAEPALVSQKDSVLVLSSPYWSDSAFWPLPPRIARPADLAPGSLARLQVARGLFGARWVRSVEFTVLK
jgi:hypothetical protein